jgi:3-dehydroquinate dehydratase
VVSFHGGTGEKYLHPTHFTSVRDILKMIRMFYWSNLRSKQMDLNRNVMESFYQRLKSIKKGKSIAELPKKLDEVNTAYSDILEWQVDLLSLLARVKDEIEHFEGHLHNLNVIYDFEGRLSTMKTTSEEDAILFGREEEFNWRLLPSIYEHVKMSINDLDSKLNIIDERQRSLVRYTHDFVNTLVAMGNINLQKDIRNLTRWAVIIAGIAYCYFF